MEESSQMLKAYIPRMINDALKLTIDQIFKKKQPEGEAGTKTIDWSKPKNKLEDTFPIEGYPDNENLWDLIL
jgi:hypothetical protein